MFGLCLGFTFRGQLFVVFGFGLLVGGLDDFGGFWYLRLRCYLTCRLDC